MLDVQFNYYLTWFHHCQVQELQAKVTTKCFFDVDVGGNAIGTVVLGLFGEVAPKTVENFRALCTGKQSYFSAAALNKLCNMAFC